MIYILVKKFRFETLEGLNWVISDTVHHPFLFGENLSIKGMMSIKEVMHCYVFSVEKIKYPTEINLEK